MSPARSKGPLTRGRTQADFSCVFEETLLLFFLLDLGRSTVVQHAVFGPSRSDAAMGVSLVDAPSAMVVVVVSIWLSRTSFAVNERGKG